MSTVYAQGTPSSRKTPSPQPESLISSKSASKVRRRQRRGTTCNRCNTLRKKCIRDPTRPADSQCKRYDTTGAECFVDRSSYLHKNSKRSGQGSSQASGSRVSCVKPRRNLTSGMMALTFSEKYGLAALRRPQSTPQITVTTSSVSQSLSRTWL